MSPGSVIAAPAASITHDFRAVVPPCYTAESKLLLSTDRERPVGSLEQKWESRKPVESSRDPHEESEELWGDIWGGSLVGREWRSFSGWPGVYRLCSQ